MITPEQLAEWRRQANSLHALNVNAYVNPDALEQASSIVALLDEVERLRRDVRSWEACGFERQLDEARVEAAQLREQLAKVRADRDTMIATHDEVEAERDQLRREVERLEGMVPHVEVCRDPFCSHDDHFPEGC